MSEPVRIQEMEPVSGLSRPGLIRFDRNLPDPTKGRAS